MQIKHIVLQERGLPPGDKQQVSHGSLENKKPLTVQGFWRYLEVKSGFEPLYEVLQTSA